MREPEATVTETPHAATATVEHEAPKENRALEAADEGSPALEAVLAATQAGDADAVHAPRPVGTFSARLVRLSEGSAVVRFRGELFDRAVRVAPEVDRTWLELAARSGETVLVETLPEMGSTVIGMIQTRPLTDLLLEAETITLAAKKDITLVAGRSALRLRENGHVELVGTRISQISSGVLKLVGRLLRLN
jgi:hypothetical protein